MELTKDSKILIIGLGLLGGSYARALTKKGYSVSAITKEQSSIDFALKEKIINYGTTKVEPELIFGADLIIFALYPNVFVNWVKEHKNLIKKGTVITDVTGVKGKIVAEIQEILGDRAEFISAHPMAGKEYSGVEYSDDSIFNNANYLVVPTENNSNQAIEMCKKLGFELGFKNISVLSVTEHDRMIGFLSQLTHCIAISLMCCNNEDGLEKYTGDSFRDLTRIAKINDEMWSELFLLNKDILLNEMDKFKTEFDKLYSNLKNENREEMREMMRVSTKRRKLFDK